MEPQPGVVTVPEIDFVHYFNMVVGFFTSHGWDFWAMAKALVGILVAVSIPVSIFFFFAIIITVESLKKVRAREDERYNQPAIPPKGEEKKEDKVAEEQARRWRKVVEHVESNNPNDWKQAIIEADVMLEQLVTKLGYRGETLGEQLKRTIRGDFKTKDQAWEAHLVRNRIAHDGSEYDLNQLEAKRVIGLYRQVFEEFYHISSK